MSISYHFQKRFVYSEKRETRGRPCSFYCFRHAKPCAAAGEPGADVPGADGGHCGTDDRRAGGQRPGDGV